MQPYFAIELSVSRKQRHFSMPADRKQELSRSALMRHIAAEESETPPQKAMLYWLAEACKSARADKDRNQSVVAASLNQSQSSVTRFENHSGLPRDIDAMVAAYADDLDLDPMQLWTRALGAWASNGGEADERTMQKIEQEVADLASRSQTNRPPRAQGASEQPAKRKARGT